MKKYIINLGLDSNKNNLSQSEIEKIALNKLGNIKIIESNKKQSKSENTLILVVEASYKLYSMINKLSKKTEQDCIAVYDIEKNKGKLIGPLSKKWGKFNRDYFLFN